MNRSEFRIRLKFPVRGMKVVASSAPLPPLPLTLIASSHVQATPAKPLPTERVSGAVESELMNSEVTKQLQSDRKFIETFLARLLESVHELQKEHDARLAELQQAVVEVALTVATRLLHQQVGAGEFNIEGMVRDMIAQLGDDEPITISLNPEDLALLQSRLDGKPLLPDDPANPRVIADASLGRGDARVEGKRTTLLSELPAEMTEIREELMRSLGHASGT